MTNDIDWNATGSWMQAWAGFANAAAIGAAAWIGAGTFRKWLRQKQVERRIDAGEKILTLVYRAKDAFVSVRSPALFSGENDQAEKSLREQFPEYDAIPLGRRRRLAWTQSIITRLWKLQSLWDDYWSLLPLAKVYFGAEFETQFRRIWAARARIYGTAGSYGAAQELNPEVQDQFERVLWSGVAAAAGAEDPIDSSIDALITAAENLISPILTSEAS